MNDLSSLNMKLGASNWYYTPYYSYAPSLNEKPKVKKPSEDSLNFRQILNEKLKNTWGDS